MIQVGWRFCQVCGRSISVFNYSCNVPVTTCQHYSKEGYIVQAEMLYISKIFLDKDAESEKIS